MRGLMKKTYFEYEDGDEYAIDRWGTPYALEVYKEKVE